MLTTSEVQQHLADPVLSAAIASSNDVAAAQRLSELLTETQLIPIGRVAAWGASVGLRSKIQEYADTVGHPLRSLALTAMDMLVRGSDFDISTDGQMLNVFLQAGSITQAQLDMLTYLSIKPRSITPTDVAKAIRNDDGSSKV